MKLFLKGGQPVCLDLILYRAAVDTFFLHIVSRRVPTEHYFIN